MFDFSLINEQRRLHSNWINDSTFIHQSIHQDWFGTEINMTARLWTSENIEFGISLPAFYHLSICFPSAKPPLPSHARDNKALALADPLSALFIDANCSVSRFVSTRMHFEIRSIVRVRGAMDQVEVNVSIARLGSIFKEMLRVTCLTNSSGTEL